MITIQKQGHKHVSVCAPVTSFVLELGFGPRLITDTFVFIFIHRAPSDQWPSWEGA